LAVYTNDCLIFSPSAPYFQTIIQSLQKTFLLKDKGEIIDFLGICVHHDPETQTIMLTQLGLSDSALMDLGLLFNDGHPVQHKFSPATSIL